VKQKDRDYVAGLFPALLEIKDEGMGEKVIQTWFHAWKQSNFLRIEDVHQFEPARQYISYTNVDHTNQVCQAGQKMAAMAAEVLNLRVNLDYVLAGALLHDVDKIVIFDAKTGGFSEMGRQIPHAVLGAALGRAEGLPEEVAHIVEAHSIQFSPLPPKSIEALIVRQADLLVANATYMGQGLDMDKVLSASLARTREA
jgi:putative nucleotidyltransferase with HDIG domain